MAPIWKNASSFEWDLGNIEKNWIKHQVTYQEAEEAFFSRPALVFEDEGHSESERRLLLWGQTGKGRYLAVVFTYRVEKIRVISARPMNRKERTAYEKTKENPDF